MDNTLTSVLAALGGSVIGASTPVLSNFVLQRSVTQRELTNREIAQREELYSEFIRQGTSCYAKALSQKGYAGTALSDLMRATGLEQGGIYRHFESNQDLSEDAFDHA